MELAHELLVASPDWREAMRTVTVIDVADFAAAVEDPDPSWIALCETADEYVGSLPIQGKNSYPTEPG